MDLLAKTKRLWTRYVIAFAVWKLLTKRRVCTYQTTSLLQFIENAEGDEELSEDEEQSEDKDDSEQLRTETSEANPEALGLFTKLTIDGKVEDKADSRIDPAVSEKRLQLIWLISIHLTWFYFK